MTDPVTEPAVRRPVLRYHGGKWKLAPWVIAHFPPHQVYVEPFAGAASVLLRKPRSYAEVLDDLDDDIVNVFAVLRDPVQAARLAHQLEHTPWSRTEFNRSYQADVVEPVERARRTVVRAYMGFGTTSRKPGRTGFRGCPWRDPTGRKGNNTGVDDWRNFPSAIAAFTARLRGVSIECRPAQDVIRQQDSPGTLFYVDPPYVPSTRSSLRWLSDGERAYRHDLREEDHRTLAELLHAVAGLVVLSGYPSALYDAELYPDWFRTTRVHRADGARVRTEVLWLNPAAAAGLRGQLFV